MTSDRSDFLYAIEVYKLPSQEHLGAVAVAPDWQPAIEWAWLTMLRNDPDLPPVFDSLEGRVEPRWEEPLGPPHVAKLQVQVVHAGKSFAVDDIPVSYFQPLAELASAEFVNRGQLSLGEVFHYGVHAYRAADSSSPEGERKGARFTVRAATVPLEVADRSLDEFLARSRPYGNTAQNGQPAQGADRSQPRAGRGRGALDAEPLPAFIPDQVLAETADLMRAAGPKETGGILIGHLHRDSSRPDLLLEVTSQIPAQHTEQELTQLTFTPDTWAAVDRAIAVRDRHELYLGWWHTHPVGHWAGPSQSGPNPIVQRSDRVARDFFSVDDVMLHRTVFPRAYSIALVLSDYHQGNGEPSLQLYGWERGMIAPRGFHVLKETGGASLLPELSGQRSRTLGFPA